jgi:hypothetical protein
MHRLVQIFRLFQHLGRIRIFLLLRIILYAKEGIGSMRKRGGRGRYSGDRAAIGLENGEQLRCLGRRPRKIENLDIADRVNLELEFRHDAEVTASAAFRSPKQIRIRRAAGLNVIS